MVDNLLGIYALAIIFVILLYLFSGCYCGVFCFNRRIHLSDNNTNNNQNNNINTNANNTTTNNTNQEIIIVKVVDFIPCEIILDTENLPVATIVSNV
jgi:hypothetical protein